MTDPRTFVHRIDADDRLVHVNDEWLAFAAENAGVGLAREDVIGRPLFGYISDRSTAQLYRELVKRVRDSSVPVEVPFRCDAPDRRRHLRMEIRSRGEGEVEFASRVEREEPRERVALLDFLLPRSGPYLRMCSWCKMVDTPEGWREPEEAVAALGLFDSPALPEVTHAICEPCHDRLTRDLSLSDR